MVHIKYIHDSFSDVEKRVFTTHFINIVVEAKDSGSSHDLKLWLEGSKGMFPVKYFYSNKSSLCVG